ncbi:MAG: dockerin type I domain-containing protein [Planctomycetota bacterium]|nr:dockerin type I domain-containing protein [Planctomycetota bacterium]
MLHSPFRTLAACALGTLIGTGSASMGEVMLANWTDDENFYYYLKHMPDFDQKRCEDQEPSIKGLGNDGRNHCVPTATTNVFSYIASHGFPHIDPGVIWNPGSDFRYNFFGEFIDDLGDDMDTDPWGGTNYNDYYNEIRDRLACEFVVKLYIADDDYAPDFKGLCRSAINGHLVLVRYGYYDDDGMTDSGRYKIDRTGGHLTTFMQGWGWNGTEIMTVRDPATGGDDCYTQSDFSSRSWHCEERMIRDEYGGERVQCYLWEPGSSNNDYGDSRRYLDGYISIIPNRFYSWGPYDNGLRIIPLDHRLHDQVPGPIGSSSHFADWYVAEFHPSPNGLGGWAMMRSQSGARRIAELDIDRNLLVPVETMDRDIQSFTPDRYGRIWMADQNAIRVVDPEDGWRTSATYEVQGAPAALACGMNVVAALLPGERCITFFPDAPGGQQPLPPVKIDLPDEISLQGACRMDIDPSTGSVALWSEARPDTVWNLRPVEGGTFVAEAICGGQGGETAPVSSFQFDDRGDMVVLGESGARFFGRNEQGRWNRIQDHPLASWGQQGQGLGGFRMLRSSTNLPSQLPADQYDNAGLQYESSDSAMEQLDCDTDINLDGKIDVSDLLIVIREWGKTRSPADVERDEIVDVLDLLAVFETWGECE